LQVHRSRWVSHDAIDKAERRGNAAQLILTNGSIIPLSRGHMPELRAKGIL
jgi:DNA-binding LytR/AlgR family response regulator